MLALEKLPKPKILEDNMAKWTKAYLEALAKGRKVSEAVKTRYRHNEIKSQIKRETSGKCAYCESKITHIYPGDVEHILPSSKFPELIFEWTNLTLACGECNRRKSDYYDAVSPLINPYIDEPSDHFFVCGPLIYAHFGDSKGHITELTLELNRAELIERRIERIASLRNLAELYKSKPNGILKSLLERELRKELAVDKEYTFVTRCFINLACGISHTT